MTKALRKTAPPPIPTSTRGIKLDQLLTMLQAAQAQGATQVQLACRTPQNLGITTDVDWVSMAPVEGVVYIGAMLYQEKWEPASNLAMVSLDW